MRRYANSPLPALHAMYTSATSSPATSRNACSSSSVVLLSTSSPAARLLSTSLEYLWLLSWIYTASISSAVSTFSATIWILPVRLSYTPLSRSPFSVCCMTSVFRLRLSTASASASCVGTTLTLLPFSPLTYSLTTSARSLANCALSSSVFAVLARSDRSFRREFTRSLSATLPAAPIREFEPSSAVPPVPP